MTHHTYNIHIICNLYQIHLVDGGAVGVVHLVELVDEAHAPVRQHQRAALQRPLLRHRVLVHAWICVFVGLVDGAEDEPAEKAFD